MKKKLLLLTLIAIFQHVIGQEQVTNFQPKDGDKGSDPGNFIEFNQKLYFTATTEGYGSEIWVSNGNENEAYLLKDINPGKNNGIVTSFAQSSVIINNTLYFIASDGNSNGEIWKTDGTKEGTVKVTNFLNAKISKLTLVGENFYFLNKIDNLLQVWFSDGSEAGTQLVKDNLPIWNSPSFQGKANNTFIFTFQPPSTNNSRVWRSDGTTVGTFPVTEELDGNGAGQGGTAELSHYIEFNNELYFVSRHYLHKTDGTLGNTEQITSLHHAYTNLINFGDAIVANGKLYFLFFEADYNRTFIWQSDGTEMGSTKIYEKTNPYYYIPSNLVNIENNLFFCGGNDSGGTSIKSLNLIDNSVKNIKEIQEGIDKPSFFYESFDAGKLQTISNNRIFCSSSGENRYSPRKSWISSLTEETTFNIQILDNLFSVFNFNESFYFSKKTEVEGNELWKSDGTENNSTMIDNINKSKHGGMNNKLLASLNSNLIFTADNGSTGDELWKYDGTNLMSVKDIREGNLGSNGNSFINHKHEIFFVSNDGISGYELWKTNGTETGTQLVQDISEGLGSSYPSHLTIYDGVLYFIALQNNSYHLCSTDGTTIKFIIDFGGTNYGPTFSIKEMNSAGDYLYYIEDGVEENLWISDGTETGSYKLKDFNYCNNLTEVNGKLFFNAIGVNQDESELWVTEGTESSTKLVKDIGVGYSSHPSHFTNFNGELIFTASTNESGREIWKSDGSENGTVQLMDIWPGNQNSLRNPNFSVVDNTLYFSANNGISGQELWKTDGSELGTLLVKDINVGSQGSFVSEITSIDDELYFQAYDPQHGFELWKSDGTEVGTLLVSDILPGNLGSCPTNILSIGNDIFFIAESVVNGRQIWKVQNNAVVSVSEFPNNSEITIFPNPSTDFVHIDSGLKPERISIYNINGQLVNFKNTDNNSIDISTLPAGMYIMKFEINGNTFNKKIIKR